MELIWLNIIEIWKWYICLIVIENNQINKLELHVFKSNLMWFVFVSKLSKHQLKLGKNAIQCITCYNIL